MPYPYITADDVRVRIGVNQVNRIYDDDDDGTADNAELANLARDASARVAAALRASRRYNIDLIAAEDPTPSEVIRLSLDVAEVYAAKRFPEVVRKSWVDLNEALKSELKALVNGDMMIDSTAVLSGDDGVTGKASGGQPHFNTEASRGW